MPLFKVTLESLRIEHAGEDGPDGDAEWFLDFFADPFGAPRSANFARLDDSSVHSGDSYNPNIQFFVSTTEDERDGVTLRAVGHEIDGGQNPDDELPVTQLDIARGESTNTTFIADVTTEAQTGTQGPSEHIFRYEADWQIEQVAATVFPADNSAVGSDLLLIA